MPQIRTTLFSTASGGSDGASPYASLTNVNGVLYGTTESGGANRKGTVFKVTTSGTESVLYSFGGGEDGAGPSSLTNVNGVLYGTTETGGGPNPDCGFEIGCGTVFKITTSGAESVLHRFAGVASGTNRDGFWPSGGLTNVNGVLYGTTKSGGINDGCSEFGGQGCGTVFKITTSGAESVLHSFGGFISGVYDGAQPVAGLTDVNGVLYGMTPQGGSNGSANGCSFGCGTVLSITTSGMESVLYNFANGSGGAFPNAGLTNVDGVLYGTVGSGGAYGNGTFFSITTSGIETVLRSFGGGPYPGPGDLTNVNGVLYGTALGGENGDDGYVVKFTTSGAESVLYSFGGGNDGAGPYAGLTYLNGVFYGMTVKGGADRKGTVFSLSL